MKKRLLLLMLMLVLVLTAVYSCNKNEPVSPDSPNVSEPTASDINPETSQPTVLSPSPSPPAVSGPSVTPSIRPLSAKPKNGKYIIVGFDPVTADYGPFTIGSKTAGIQEALYACVDNEKDLFITGGYGGNVVYNISQTIHVPAAQDFRIDGGVYVMNWTGPVNQNMIIIDSAMNCEYHFGIFVYGGDEKAVVVQPKNPVPIDGFAIFIESYLFSQGVADPSPFEAGRRESGTAISIDASFAPVSCSEFEFLGGVLNFATDVETRGAVTYCRLYFDHLHANAHESTLMTVDGEFMNNYVYANIGVDQGASGVTGLVMKGSFNTVELNSRAGGFLLGSVLVLEKTAEHNEISLFCADELGGGNPLRWVTDKSIKQNNRLILPEPRPLSVLAFSGNTAEYQQLLISAYLVLTGGNKVEVTLTRGDSNTKTSIPYENGMTLKLNPGDKISIKSETNPYGLIIPA